MRVLLDENLPRKLKWRLEGVEALTVVERGWSGIKNGELLKRAQKEFDVLITMDRGIEFQQNVDKLNLSIFLLAAPSNDYDDLLPLVQNLNKQLKNKSLDKIVKISS